MVRIVDPHGRDDSGRRTESPTAPDPRAGSKAFPSDEVPQSAPSRRLLSSGFAPAAWALIVVGIGITAVLGFIVAHQGGPGRLDTAVDNWLLSTLHGHRRVLWSLSELGSPAPVALLAIALGLLCLSMRRSRGVWLTAVAVPLAAALSEFVLKHIIGRTHGHSLSFPSGHTTGISALATVFAILLLGPLRPPLPTALRVTLASGGAVLTAVVAISLVATNQHYLTDTVGGAGLGVSMTLLTALIIDRIGSGRRAQAVRPEATIAHYPDEAGQRDTPA
jgi:membrane-associated phospholipid phosphatase